MCVEPVHVLRDESSFAQATRDQIFRYFALCMRGEKFGDGYIANEFDEGRILAALCRLRDICPATPSTS